MRTLLALAITGMSLVLLALPEQTVAHPGGLNSEGCHNNRKTGGYHCHGKKKAAPATPRRSQNGSVYYANCDAVRAAGKAPLKRGDPGYRSGLDRDNDGYACEYSRFNPR